MYRCLFLFNASRSAVGSSQPIIQWIAESPGVKVTGREVTPCNFEVQNDRIYTFTSTYAFTFCAGTSLISNKFQEYDFRFFFIVLSCKENFRSEISDSAAHKNLSSLHRSETWEGPDYIQGRRKHEFVFSLVSGNLSLYGHVDEDKSCLK